MSRHNPQPTDFRPGDRVRVLDGCTTAPASAGHIGSVVEPSPKYRFRVGVQFYVDRDFHVIYFHPSELVSAREGED